MNTWRTFLYVLVGMVVMGGSLASHDAEAKIPTDTLVIAASAIPVTLDMDFGGSLESWEVIQNCCDPLTEFVIKTNPDGTREVDPSQPPACLLCESYMQSADGMKFTIKLKRGVKSFYGNELTAEDVKWSWERSVAVKAGGVYTLSTNSIDQTNPVTVIDAYTIEVNLTGANPLLPLVFGIPHPFAPILDSTEVKQHVTAEDPWAKDWLATHTAGFGPYHVQSITPGQEAIWVANPNYHRSKPKIQKVIYKQVPDGATRAVLLARGVVDIATELSPRQREQLSSKRGVVIESRLGNEAIIFGMNNKVPPMDNVKVRQAMAYALPVDDIIQTVYLNQAGVELAPGYAPAYYPGALDRWPYKTDMAKAKDLLQEAGVGPFSVRLAFNSARPTHQEVATLIRTALAPIGIEVVLDKLSPAKYQEQYFTRKAETVLVQDASWLADGPYTISLYFHSGDPGVGNWINYKNPAVDDLLNRGLNTRDFGERARLAGQAHEIILSQAPWGFYLHTGYHVPRRENVKGFVWRTNNLLRFYDFFKE